MIPGDVRQDSPLANLSEQRFGRPTQAVRSVIAVGTTATTIAKNNPARIGLIVCNMGANTLYVEWANTVAAAAGIPIASGGGVMILGVEEDGEVVGWELDGVCATAVGQVLVVEVLVI